MPNRIGFFNPIVFPCRATNSADWFLEKVDSIFAIGHRKAYVIQRTTRPTVALAPDQVSLKRRIASLAFLLLPALTRYLPQNSSSRLLKGVRLFFLYTSPVLLILKVFLRCACSFEVVDVQKEQEEGISLTSETTDALSSFLLDPASQTHTIYTNSEGRVFSLNTAPALIFKEGQPSERYQNAITLRTACLVHGLSHIVIPRSRQVLVGEKWLLAQEKLSGAHTDLDDPDLDDTVDQLTHLIALTALCDIEHRNMIRMPGTRQVAIIDIERLWGPTGGLFGGSPYGTGLIHCLRREEQLNRSLAIAAQYGFKPKSETLDQFKESCLIEIATHKDVYQFYADHGIKDHPRKPLTAPQLDASNANTPCKINGKIYSLQVVVEAFIALINDKIASANHGLSTRLLRYVKLTQHDILPFLKARATPIPDQGHQSLIRALNILKEHNLIFSYQNITGAIPNTFSPQEYYLVQA